MTIPTGAVIPPLIIAFALLAFDHYRANPDRPATNFRFLMMVAAVLMMVVQLIFGGEIAWLSPLLLALALIWLAVASVQVARRFRSQ